MDLLLGEKETWFERVRCDLRTASFSCKRGQTPVAKYPLNPTVQQLVVLVSSPLAAPIFKPSTQQ